MIATATRNQEPSVGDSDYKSKGYKNDTSMETKENSNIDSLQSWVDNESDANKQVIAYQESRINRTICPITTKIGF